MGGSIGQKGTDLCLNVDGNAETNGATVNSWSCNSHAAQKWTVSGDSIQKKGTNLCLNVHENAETNGATVNLWSCNSLASQKWTVSGDSIQKKGTNLCLTATYWVGQVYLLGCTSHAACGEINCPQPQKWTYHF